MDLGDFVSWDFSDIARISQFLVSGTCFWTTLLGLSVDTLPEASANDFRHSQLVEAIRCGLHDLGGLDSVGAQGVVA